jgi:hypothetical protein
MTGARIDHRLSDALGLVAEELADLARLADALDAAIAGLAARLGVKDATVLTNCQAADLFAQRLAGVAEFVAGLGAKVPAEVTVDLAEAIRGLTLGDQAERFAGAERPSDPSSDRGGVVCLFDAP